ncbi:DUF3592 domain-containing protein [Salinirubellus sp. GCM10025818]|uniref:DUF3592 domain-containing protein n=1 Tax=Salinirubellus TaxID=2162630 RepID=UPI0030D36978
MGDDGLSINGPKTLGQSLLLLLVAVGLAGYGAVDYVQSTNAVRDSVETEATITEVGVETESSTAGTGSDIEYEPVVEFTYIYEGETYTGDELFPGSVPTRYDSESAARNAIAEYEPETKTTAYVDPDDPETAFLENRTSNRQLLFIGVGLILALFGGFSAVKNYRRERT